MPTREEEEWGQYFTTEPTTDVQQDEEDWSQYFDGAELYTVPGYSSDLRFSKEHFKERQGRGGLATLEKLEEKTGYEAPDIVTNFLKDLQAEGEEGTKGYKPDYPGYVTEQPVLPWMKEQIGQQAFENIVLYGGGLLSAVAKRAALPVAAVTAGVTFNSIHDETLNELAHLNNKTVEQLSPEEKETAFYTALQNTALEMVNPFYSAKTKKFTKGVKGKDFLKEIEKFVNKTKKEGFTKVAGKFAKSSMKLGAGEAATEAAEQLNIMRVSEPGLAHAGTQEGTAQLLSGLAGGYAGGTTFGAPAAYREATDVNRTIKEGAKALERINQQNLLASGKEYQTELQRGPVPLGFDVTPELYQVPELDKSFLQKFGGLAGEKLLGRSTNIFQEALKRAKTGKDVHTIHNELFSMFGDVETFAGKEQAGTSFNTLKHVKLGKYAPRFAQIQSKWSSAIPFAGEMGETMNPLIDAYVGAQMTKQGVNQAREDVRSVLSRRQLKELDNDIAELREIHDMVHKDLKEILGESGLELGYTENYVTRGIDVKSIQDDKEGFINSLVNDVGVLPKGMSKKEATDADKYAEAERIYNDILNGKDPSIMTSEQIRQAKTRKGETRKGFEKRRDMKWDNLDNKYRNQSAFKSMQDYLTRAATRSASAKVFGGNRAEKLSGAVDKALKRGLLTNEEAQTVWDMYDAEHNIYRRPRNERERAGQQASKFLATGTAISLLGLATISSITEPAWISGRVGVANMMKATPTVAAHVLKGMMRTIYKGKRGKEVEQSFGRDLLNVMGMAINPQVNERIEMLMSGDVNPMLTTWFRTPGGFFLTQYTNFVRTWTAVAGLKMIQDQAKKVNKLKGQKKAALERELRENGMSMEDFKEMKRLGGGQIDIFNDQFLDSKLIKSDGTHTTVRDLLVPWLRKITTDVAMEPHVGNRPLWMSNPNLQLLSQLKSFPILFGNTIMKRTMRQLNPKVCTPGITGAVGALGSTAAALALASMAVQIKDIIRGTEEDRDWRDTIAAVGIPYAGTASLRELVIPAGVSVADTFINNVGKGLVGDTEQPAEDFLKFLMKATVGTILAEQVDR